MRRANKTCHCNAYPFPHRAGGGRCDDPGEKPRDCLTCCYGQEIVDPYCTGDYGYKEIECNAPEGCYWEDAA